MVAILKDASPNGGLVIGFNGEGNLAKPISIDSQLPQPVVISATSQTDKDAPLQIKYNGKTFDTKSKACKMGKYNRGKYRQGDCGFDCTFGKVKAKL